MVIQLDATAHRGWARASAQLKSRRFARPSCAQWTAERKRSVFDGENTDSEVSRWNGRTYCNA